MSHFIICLIQRRSVNLSLIAQDFVGHDPNSAYKRLQRFIKQVTLPYNKLAHLIASIVGLDKRGTWTLIFDRTNWKLGSKHINVLHLAVCRNGLAIPLFFTFLKGKKSGNSNQADRIELMQKFIKTFGKKCVGLILGDREFIGCDWFRYLLRDQIPFCVRLKDGWQKVRMQHGRLLELKKCFRGLKKGETRALGLCQLGEDKHAVKCFVTGIRNDKGDWIIVAHSENLENPCEIYRKRWQIETMFRAMKTGGFQLEDTRITVPERVECLLGIVCLAFAICYKAGEFSVKESPPKRKKHGFWPKTVFRVGLDRICHAISQFHHKTVYLRRLFTQIFSPIRLTKKFFVL